MPRNTQEEHGRFLSHFNLLFRHGSQFMALRALFVGGRPSLGSGGWPGGGDARTLTVPAVVAVLRDGFGRDRLGEEGELRSAIWWELWWWWSEERWIKGHKIYLGGGAQIQGFCSEGAQSRTCIKGHKLSSFALQAPLKNLTLPLDRRRILCQLIYSCYWISLWISLVLCRGTVRIS